MRSLLAIAFSALVLGLVACGDDNNDTSSTQSTKAQGSTQTGTTTTGTKTGADSSKPKSRSHNSSTSESKSQSKSDASSKRKSSSGSSGSGGSGSNSGGDISGKIPPKPKGSKPGKYTEQEANDLSSQLVAKRVCQGYLPTQTAKDLKSGKTTKKKIAKAYSKGWPANKRAVAYKGCLQGLNARK